MANYLSLFFFTSFVLNGLTLNTKAVKVQIRCGWNFKSNSDKKFQKTLGNLFLVKTACFKQSVWFGYAFLYPGFEVFILKTLVFGIYSAFKTTVGAFVTWISKKSTTFKLLLFFAYYEKLKQKKKTHNEKIGRPIEQYSNICYKEKNHNLQNFFLLKKTAESNIFKMCILRLITASIFLGMSFNMARNCFLIEYGNWIFHWIWYSCLSHFYSHK